jgi:hypothetical protein
MKTKRLLFIKSTLIIFLCFWLTSTGHMSWMYHLMEQTSAGISFQISTVAGYALQAAGVFVFAFLLRKKRISPKAVFIASVTACLSLLTASAYMSIFLTSH